MSVKVKKMPMDLETKKEKSRVTKRDKEGWCELGQKQGEQTKIYMDLKDSVEREI